MHPVAARRSFAIISHPDAGKTTLTEKLLLMAGAIHLAGAVRVKGERRRTRSDWMKIEQQRGISVTTSVMTFIYRACVCTLLDTPGHEDFSEDTFRTLTAVDAAVMVIDAAKGIEPQTRKLFEVCRLRDIPILTFINKVDRESRDPFRLLDEISDTLALDCVPMFWPAGSGRDFAGMYDLCSGGFIPFAAGAPTTASDDDAALAQGGCAPFNRDSFLEGNLTPVYFGSALRDFGVCELLDAIVDLAPPPRLRPSTTRWVAPNEEGVTGFVFKVQANMDPRHRDRIAFLRLCSGRFRRGMKLRHVRDGGRVMTVHNPILFLARERELVEEAWPGDVIGIPNHGILRVGDTLSENEDLSFTGIPDFAPDILRRVQLSDPMKAKHLRKALLNLAEEGVIQVFQPLIGAQWVVGAVGPLQLDVLMTRIEQEYAVQARLEPAPWATARWISAADPEVVLRFTAANRSAMALDRDDASVFLARSGWELLHQQENWPAIQFAATRERA